MTKSGKKKQTRSQRICWRRDERHETSKHGGLQQRNGFSFFSFPRQLQTWDESNRIKRDAIQYSRNLIDDETGES